MQEQFTRCPHCRAVFRFQGTGPETGDDKVCCSHCHQWFSVLQHLVMKDKFGWFRTTEERTAPREDAEPMVTSTHLDGNLRDSQNRSTIPVSRSDSQDHAEFLPTAQTNEISSVSMVEQPNPPDLNRCDSNTLPEQKDQARHGIDPTKRESLDRDPEFQAPAANHAKNETDDEKQFGAVSWTALKISRGTNQSEMVDEERQGSEHRHLLPDTAELEGIDKGEHHSEQSNNGQHGPMALSVSSDGANYHVSEPKESQVVLSAGNIASNSNQENTKRERISQDNEGSAFSGLSLQASDSGSLSGREPFTKLQIRDRVDVEQTNTVESHHIDDIRKPASLNRVPIRAESLSMNGVDKFIADRPNPFMGVIWFLVALGFLFLLALQVRVYFVDRYAQDERFRPYLALFCQVAACDMPIRQDPYRLFHTSTEVNLHPDDPDAVKVTVKFVNQATFSQSYPDLRLTLNDDLGRVIGRRTFRPEMYRQHSAQELIDPGEQVSVVFDLAHPHESAVGFIVDIVRESGL